MKDYLKMEELELVTAKRQLDEERNSVRDELRSLTSSDVVVRDEPKIKELRKRLDDIHAEKLAIQQAQEGFVQAPTGEGHTIGAVGILSGEAVQGLGGSKKQSIKKK